MTANHPQEPDGDDAGGVFDLDSARRAREARAAEPVNLTKPAADHDDQERNDQQHDDDPDDEAGAASVLVEGQVLAVRENTSARPPVRREVLPGWAKDRASATAAMKWAASHYGHATGYHVVRAPGYYARVASHSPLGLVRILAAMWRWVFDHEDRDTRRAVFGATTDAAQFLKLREEHRNQVRARLFMVTLALLCVTGLVLYVVFGLPVLAQVVVGLVAVAGLGVLGRNKDRPIAGRAVATSQEPRLTSDLITGALATLQMPQLRTSIEKDPHSVVFVSPIQRDGAGWRAEIDLPGGVTAGEVIERRGKLASGLRRPLGKVWPEADPETHEGRLILYVADKALSKAKPTPWPLTKGGKVNLFEPFPLGTDQRGRVVMTTLMFVSVLIGAVPRMGKTFLQRQLMLAAALDVRARLYVFDLKGGGDWMPLRHVAHAFRVGDDPEDMNYLLATLRELRAEMRRRYKVFRKIGFEVCPESKVTDALASDRDLGLFPVLVALDECGLAFGHAEYGAEITEICADLVKRGPAAGIILIPATQRIDAKSVPTEISSSAVLRFALKVMDHTANDMILGSGMYKSGVRATMFGRDDKGICLMAGEGNEPVLVRAAYVDAADAEKIALRAREARKAAGLLTGLAAGEEEPDTDTGSVLDHLLAVWPADDPEWSAGKIWCEELAARLAASQPGLYAGWTGAQVTSAVRPHGVETVQVKHTVDGIAKNKRGLRRIDLTDALAASGISGHTDDPQRRTDQSDETSQRGADTDNAADDNAADDNADGPDDGPDDRPGR